MPFFFIPVIAAHPTNVEAVLSLSEILDTTQEPAKALETLITARKRLWHFV